jgi:hypothetical protein
MPAGLDKSKGNMQNQKSKGEKKSWRAMAAWCRHFLVCWFVLRDTRDRNHHIIIATIIGNA